ncbi:MAG: Ig-like domain-containing protein, partial [Myxococcota bacterium]
KLEREVELEGELQVFYEDGEDWSRLRHVLKDASGKRRSLHFAEKPPDLLTGDRVRVRGVEVPLEGGEESGAVVAYCCGGDGGVQLLAAAALPNTLGEQRTLVLLVNFQDKPEQPWTLAQARELVFGGPSEFIREASYGQTWLTGDVYGWITISASSSSCPTSAIVLEANQAAEATGLDVSSYDRLVYAFPHANCFWSGRGSIGGSPSEALFNGFLGDLGTVVHELGHNLGLHHSRSLDCSGGVLGGECTSNEYGDFFDVMGGLVMHFNAFQKERLGWLGSGSSPPLTSVGASGTYAIGSYEPAKSEPKALKILRSVDALTGQHTFFYVEHRQAFGFDAIMSDQRFANNLDGVLVHLGTESGHTFLLDMTPASQLYDWRDPALHVGESFVDPETGIQITTVTVEGAGATLSVSLSGSPSCSRSAPRVTLSPSEGPTVAPGTPVLYTLTVSNHDGAGCAPSRFDLTASHPSGWSAAFGTSSLQIAAGASGGSTVGITSPTSASDGLYAFTIVARDSQVPGHVGSASASYGVGGGASNADPIARDDRAETRGEAAVVIDVLANDSDPDADPLRVDGTSPPAKGSVRVNPDSTVVYTPNGRVSGSDRFTYGVTDGHGGHAQAQVEIRLGPGKGRSK